MLKTLKTMFLPVYMLTMFSGLLARVTAGLQVPPPQCSDVNALASLTPSLSGVPRSLKGTWVSERCETRPGPHFVLRSYAFYPDHDENFRTSSKNDSEGETGRFELKLHVYTDPDCEDPLRSYTAQGHFGAQRPSWASPGAAEQRYWIKRVSVVAHNDQEAAHVAKSVAAVCPGRAKDSSAFLSDEIIWLQYDPKTERTRNRLPQTHHSVAYFHDESSNTTRMVNLQSPATQAPSDNLNYMEGTTSHKNTAPLDCRGELAVNWGELGLFRLSATPTQILRQGQSDTRKVLSSRSDFDLRQELLLGHPAPDAEDLPHISDEGYHPTTFQTPLILATQKNLERCSNCRLVFAADTARPPRLAPSTPSGVQSPEGLWASSTCDAASHGLFLVRKLRFRTNTWLSHQIHFTDHGCTHPAYELRAYGDYAIRETSIAGHKNDGKDTMKYRSVLPHKYEGKIIRAEKSGLRNLKHRAFKKLARSSSASPDKNPAPGKGHKNILVIFLALRNLTITPLASNVAQQLNDPNGGCGEIGQWEVGVSQDTTNNKGCKSIGISVPSLHQYPLKFGLGLLNETELLFIGDAYAPLSDSHPNMSLVFPEHDDWMASPPGYDYELTAGHPRWGWGSPLTRCADTQNDIESTLGSEEGSRYKYANNGRPDQTDAGKSWITLEKDSNAVYLRTTILERSNAATQRGSALQIIAGSIILTLIIQ